MNQENIRTEINRLSLPQKLILAQDIWDSIAMKSDKLPMPEWQKEALNKRYDQYKNSKLELHEWQEVHNGLRERHK